MTTVPDVPSSRWSDLERPALDGPALSAALTRDSALWRSLEVVQEIGSTNAALVAAAAEDAPEGVVLVAEHQVTGRGRHTVWVPGAMRWVMSALRHTPRAIFRRLPV